MSKPISIENIIRMLPHKQPAILIDKILDVSPGETITTEKNLSITENAFLGNFPGLPIYPASALVECMFQSCTLLIYASDCLDPSSQVVSLIGVNKTKFRRKIVPGSVMEIEVKKTQKRSNVWRFSVTAYVEDYVVAEGGLVVSVLERDDIL